MDEKPPLRSSYHHSSAVLANGGNGKRNTGKQIAVFCILTD